MSELISLLWRFRAASGSHNWYRQRWYSSLSLIVKGSRHYGDWSKTSGRKARPSSRNLSSNGASYQGSEPGQRRRSGAWCRLKGPSKSNCWPTECLAWCAFVSAVFVKRRPQCDEPRRSSRVPRCRVASDPKLQFLRNLWGCVSLLMRFFSVSLAIRAIWFDQSTASGCCPARICKC